MISNLFELKYGFIRIIYVLTACWCVIASCKKVSVFNMAPTTRTVNSIQALQNELIQAPYGWKVIYFPRTDSLIFSDMTKSYDHSEIYKQRVNYGGFYFLMRFQDNGMVQMQADFDAQTHKMQESEFEIKQGTFIQLSFTSHNYIHRLSNREFNGSSDFLYVGKDFFGRLIFKTASYIEPAREYILFEKLKRPEDTGYLAKAYENRVFFDNMKNPQICIHKGSRIYFKSDVFLKTTSEFITKELSNGRRVRYYTFAFATKPDPIPSTFTPKQSVLIGSGYVGTEQGLSFHSGIRYDKTTIFYDFQRVAPSVQNLATPQTDDCAPPNTTRFVCELVQVYDSLNRITLLVPKHQAPHGIPTYFTAEIYDDTASLYYKNIPEGSKVKN